jgi:hypothetical protein
MAVEEEIRKFSKVNMELLKSTKDLSLSVLYPSKICIGSDMYEYPMKDFTLPFCIRKIQSSPTVNPCSVSLK